MSEWLTVKEAAEALKCSDRYIRNRAEAGKLRAKKEGNIWLIHSSLSPAAESSKESSGIPKEAQTELIKQLQSEIIYLRSKLDENHKELSESRERSDTIIMSLTKQIEQLQLSAKKRSWAQRLFHLQK